MALPIIGRGRPVSPEDTAIRIDDQFSYPPADEAGSKVAEESIKKYRGEEKEVPPLPIPGSLGAKSLEALESTSSKEDLAQATQSDLAYRNRERLKLDESGVPVFNPDKGSFEFEPVKMSEYAEQQHNDVFAAPLQQYDIENPDAGPTKVVTDIMETVGLPQTVIEKFAAVEAPIWSSIQGNVVSALFSPDSTVKDNSEDYGGLPSGQAIVSKYGIPADLVNPIASRIGISFSRAVNQSEVFRRDGTPVAESNVVHDDTVELANITNATAHALKTSFDNTGLDIPMEAVQEFSEAMVTGERYAGNINPFLNEDGKWVYRVSPSAKATARAIAVTAEALAGDTSRPDPSKVPAISGSNFSKPGTQGTFNTLNVKSLFAKAAEVVKDMFGSVPEVFYYKSQGPTQQMRFLSKQYSDIVNNMGIEGELPLPYSTSIFAKRHGVSQEDHVIIGDRVSRPKGFDPKDPVAVAKYEAAKKEHAGSVIADKISKIKFDLDESYRLSGINYTGYTHSSSNQRFFRANRGTDIVGSKNGYRDLLNFAQQSGVSPRQLFNPKEISRLIGEATVVFSKIGHPRQKALLRLSESDRASIGLMEHAVVEYFSFSGDPSIRRGNIKRETEVDLVRMYTPEIGKHLASLGKAYHSWLNGEEADHSAILELLPKIKAGEAQAHVNLWSDMYNLHKNALETATNSKAIPLTTLNYDDGNQNGIFLQALYTGNAPILSTLGSYDPEGKDMRGLALNYVLADISSRLSGDDMRGKREAWASFFLEAEKLGLKDLETALLKAPLMQHGYGKDAAMFFENVLAFLEDTTSYSVLFRKHVLPEYGGESLLAVRDLNHSVEAAVRKSIDSSFVDMLKRMGIMFAMFDRAPSIKGVSGDVWRISPNDIGQYRDTPNDVTTNTGDYDELVRSFKERTYGTPSGVVSAPAGRRVESPSAKKEDKQYYNRVTGKFEIFKSPHGSALSRMLGVMFVQSTDGDLLKLMMLAINKSLKVPMPIATVHDSLITTMGSMHLYRNAYNNIAIPQAVHEIKHFGTRIKESYDKSRKEAIAKVSTRSHVGIGTEGDYPAVGSFFDTLYLRNRSPSFKEHFMSKKNATESSWDRYVKNSEEIIDDAIKNGWRLSNPQLAVTGKQYLHLAEAAERSLRVGGSRDELTPWIRAFESQVVRGWKQLTNNGMYRRHGGSQMGPA